MLALIEILEAKIIAEMTVTKGAVMFGLSVMENTMMYVVTAVDASVVAPTMVDCAIISSFIESMMYTCYRLNQTPSK